MTLEDHETFVAAVRPLIDTVLDMVRFHSEERQRLAPEASQGSEAFRDDLKAHEFEAIAGIPTSEPRMLAGLQLAMVEELITSYSRLVTTEPAVVMSDKILVRSAIEISGRLLWMCDQSASTRVRVGRALLERIDGLDLQRRLLKRHAEVVSERTARIEELKAQAVAAGFVVAGGTRKHALTLDGDARPGSNRSVKLVLDYGDAGEDAWIGEMGQGYLSMFVHGNIPAMLGQLSHEHSVPLDRERVGGVVVMDAQWVNLMTSFCALAYMTAVNTYRTYVGWHDVRWSSLKLNYRGVAHRVRVIPPDVVEG